MLSSSFFLAVERRARAGLFAFASSFRVLLEGCHFDIISSAVWLSLSAATNTMILLRNDYDETSQDRNYPLQHTTSML